MMRTIIFRRFCLFFLPHFFFGSREGNKGMGFINRFDTRLGEFHKNGREKDRF